MEKKTKEKPNRGSMAWPDWWRGEGRGLQSCADLGRHRTSHGLFLASVSCLLNGGHDVLLLVKTPFESVGVSVISESWAPRRQSCAAHRAAGGNSAYP